MKLRLALAGLAVLSTAAVSAPPASAATIISARVCTTNENWTFTPPLTTAVILTGGGATQTYTANCPFQIGIQDTPPFIVTSTNSYGPVTLGFSYIGGCHVAVFSRGGLPGGVLVGGIVGVFFGASGTVTNVSVKVLTPAPGICNEATASGIGVNVGTF